MNKKNFYLFTAILLVLSISCLTFSAIITADNPKNWWIVIIAFIITLLMIILICVLYFSNVEFVCPKCNKQFKPKAIIAISAAHSALSRHLKCPHCKEKQWCKEVWNIEK